MCWNLMRPYNKIIDPTPSITVALAHCLWCWGIIYNVWPISYDLY